MVKINYQDLEFDHLVIFEKDHTIFAAARERNSGHLRLFLIYQTTGNVYSRNGRADSWEELMESNRRSIIDRVRAAYNNQVPVYRINGTHHN